MIILTVRTDKPDAELSIYKDDQRIDEMVWEAHRTLVESIHVRIEQLLKANSFGWQDIGGLVCYKGPGSFTGLRIGHTVANALAYGLKCPIVSEPGEDWQIRGIKKLLAGKNEQISVPNYGGEANTSKPTR